MSWLETAVIAVLTAAAGAVAAGFVASLAVGWYRISSFEGGSGFFVAGMGVLGILGGLAIGLVTSRIEAASADPGFLGGLGTSLAALLGVTGAVGGVARSLADVPPRIDGEALHLAVEVRWPAGTASSPAALPGEGVLRLLSATRLSRTVRASVSGPLWTKDARLEDGRWVAPGAVEVFTSRGARILDVAVNEQTLAGFIVPLRGRPGKRALEWSPWLPREGRGGPARATGLNYRFRVRRRSEPARTEAVGPFEVLTIASGFHDARAGGRTTIAATAHFALRHRGRPIVVEGPPIESDRFERAGSVAFLPAPQPALLVQVEAPDGGGSVYLLAGAGDEARVELVSACDGPIEALELTSDPERFRALRGREPIRGRIDRDTLARPGLYLVRDALLDTRRLTVRRFAVTSGAMDIVGDANVPPLGVSPDERSFVRFASGSGGPHPPLLVVTDTVAGHACALSIDPARMRYASLEALDPAWLAHHFAWERGGDGVDRLVERPGFVPLPYRGQLSVDGARGQVYQLEPAGRELRDALVEFLRTEFKAERPRAGPEDYEWPVRVDGRIVIVAAGFDSRYVLVSMAPGAADTSLIAAIASRFDAALSTGRYDALFGR